jgi:hypothetical protein
MQLNKLREGIEFGDGFSMRHDATLDWAGASTALSHR